MQYNEFKNSFYMEKAIHAINVCFTENLVPLVMPGCTSTVESNIIGPGVVGTDHPV